MLIKFTSHLSAVGDKDAQDDGVRHGKSSSKKSKVANSPHNHQNHKHNDGNVTNAKKSGKVKPSKSVRRARKRMKEQLAREQGIATADVILPAHHKVETTKKAIKTKKANERKRKRHAVEREEKRGQLESATQLKAQGQYCCEKGKPTALFV